MISIRRSQSGERGVIQWLQYSLKKTLVILLRAGRKGRRETLPPLQAHQRSLPRGVDGWVGDSTSLLCASLFTNMSFYPWWENKSLEGVIEPSSRVRIWTGICFVPYHTSAPWTRTTACNLWELRGGLLRCRERSLPRGVAGEFGISFGLSQN